jgi:hypothetical protein
MRAGLLLLLWLTGPCAVAADGEKQPQPPPSLELLEFLGSWENGHGEWVDPTQFADDSFEQLTSRTSAEDGKNGKNDQ